MRDINISLEFENKDPVQEMSDFERIKVDFSYHPKPIEYDLINDHGRDSLEDDAFWLKIAQKKGAEEGIESGLDYIRDGLR